MTSQRTKNIRLLALSAVLICVAVINIFLFSGKNDNTGIDRDFFKIKATEEINKVVAERNGETTSIEYDNGQWWLNENHIANPLNIRLLFASVREVSVRREISNNTQKEALLSNFENDGKKLTFFRGNQAVAEIEVWGDDANSTTYMKMPEDNTVYLVEIPGYRAYIYGLVAISYPEWKHPVILHEMNWRNLANIEVNFPENHDASFVIEPFENFYRIQGIVETDTSKLTTYIDEISLMEVDKYLNRAVTPEDTTKKIFEVTINDVGGNKVKLNLWQSSEYLFTGAVNKKNWFILDPEKTQTLFRSKNYFNK